ncbi:MAG: chemotaxis protein CheB [Pseudomonadota bacterium]
MPADIDPGMAFVLVQHLAPDHKSILSDLIRRYTRMDVFTVEDGVVVKPNCAYIIPPGRDMAFMGDTLHLLEPSAPRGLRLPIDFFFRSLALDQRERAICIILSGTGSDGTFGGYGQSRARGVWSWSRPLIPPSMMACRAMQSPPAWWIMS